jgi:hypothetical protein
MRFICKTFFDITATGVTGHYKSSRVPFNDLSHASITDERSWNYARNQQRNWETLTQLIGLRTQIAKLENPIKDKNLWEFEFEVETSYAFGPEENPTELLQSDCNGVPMLISLGNKKNLSPMLITNGNDQNIWFEELV